MINNFYYISSQGITDFCHLGNYGDLFIFKNNFQNSFIYITEYSDLKIMEIRHIFSKRTEIHQIAALLNILHLLRVCWRFSVTELDLCTNSSK